MGEHLHGAEAGLDFPLTALGGCKVIETSVSHLSSRVKTKGIGRSGRHVGALCDLPTWRDIAQRLSQIYSIRRSIMVGFPCVRPLGDGTLNPSGMCLAKQAQASRGGYPLKGPPASPSFAPTFAIASATAWPFRRMLHWPQDRSRCICSAFQRDAHSRGKRI